MSVRSAYPVPVDLGRESCDVAPELVGLVLVHVKGGRTTAGRIVECEAYGSVGEDTCSHTYRGETPRNAVMFGPSGRIYVYFTYGMHYCANIVAHPRGRTGAVLLRALEPIEGVALMRRRRGASVPHHRLCAGPARLVVAMGLGRSDNGRRLDTGRLHLVDDGTRPPVGTSTRVGVSCEHAGLPWRFGVPGSPFLSRPLPLGMAPGASA